jgi:recombination associated protein RdgC
MMICLQIEEKILPATVIRQELSKKIKEIAQLRGRKVSQKEIQALKDDVTHSLLPRAFSKLTRVYAYIDTKNQWLVIDTASAPKTEEFMELLKKSLTAANIQPVKTAKLAPILTRWLLNKDYPQAFSIEKSCLFRDPNKEARTIRCQQQDLSANSIQLIVKEGCEVNELALAWHDHVNFVLADNFSLRSIKFQDEVIAQAKEMEPETKKQQLDADLLIMAETLSGLLKDLLAVFVKPATPENAENSAGFSEHETPVAELDQM